MTIRTARLLLREFKPDDAESVFRIESRPEMVRYQLFAERTRERSEAYVREAIEGRRRKPRVYFELAIEIEGHGMIGRIGCVLDDGRARMWYVVETAFQGQGIATEAATAFLDAIWQSTEAAAVMIECDPRNTPSWRLAESLGFCLLKETPNAMEVKGELCGSREYRLLRPDTV